MALTRREKLICMKGCDLIRVADKLGVKVSCNRARTALKESKEAVVDRVIAAEEKIAAETQKPAEPEVKTEDKPEIEVVNDQTDDQANDQTDDQNDTERWEDDSYNDRQARAEESDQTAEKAMNQKNTKAAKRSEEKPAEKKAAGKNAQLEYNGRSQNICAWAKELGISANTLYGRIYKMGWPIEKAFETPPRRR